MKSNSNINELEIYKKENSELKTRLSINSKIIQEFFKNSNINEKTALFIENIKKENNLLLSQIHELKIQNQKLITIKAKNNNNKDVETYENKLFIYENLLKEKQSIIINLKEQNKNLKEIIDLKNNASNQLDNNDENINNNHKYIIEEIYVISPQKIVNTMNNKIEFYKDINMKYKNLIQELKSNLSTKEKENLKLEEEALSMKLQLQKYNQQKNNEDIINQLIQYQSMKSIPIISHSCTNFNNIENKKFSNEKKISRNKKTKSVSHILNYTHDIKKKKLLKEIEVYENVNKTVKEISKNDFDLAEEWAETLKQCSMTQQEFLKFCNLKITNKLTNAIEYLYKILIDKNIQIKLLIKENETLNEENIKLNKINIEMESLVDYYEKNSKNNNNDNINNDNINENNFYCNKNKKNDIIIKNNSSNNNKSSSSKKQNQKTFVNVDNNITHTNININMMMDYHKKNDDLNNKTSITSSEFKEGLILNELSIKNKENKIIRKKINNKSYNKLIKEKKNLFNEKTFNLMKNNNNFNYNKTIKNIFNSTEKIKLKQKQRNLMTNINLGTNTFFNDVDFVDKYKKIIKYKNVNKHNLIQHSKSENKIFEINPKYNSKIIIK